LPSLDVRCCMRVEDSIDRGVSFFMAELLRLKSVVDASRAAKTQPVLYLLDEILQGTNTAERQIASRRVMRALAKSHAIGAVSSHDLELFESEDVRDLAIPVHFAEQFWQQANPPEMTFDYRLRDGIATSTNALALMEMLGFEDLSRR
jgi:DNA mismatch repair ATPase MutS